MFILGAEVGQFRLRTLPELWFRLSENGGAKISASGFYDAAYEIEGRGGFTQQKSSTTQRVKQSSAIPSFALKLSDNLDIKRVKQIVVWGKSDNLPVLANP